MSPPKQVSASPHYILRLYLYLPSSSILNVINNNNVPEENLNLLVVFTIIRLFYYSDSLSLSLSLLLL